MVFADILDMALEIGEAFFQCGKVLSLQVFLGYATMHLERPDGGDDHDAVGFETRLATLDVEELLGAEIGAKSGFGDDIVGELERRLGGNYRIAAMSDVGEGAAMNEGRIVLERLHQIGRERVLEQSGH